MDFNRLPNGTINNIGSTVLQYRGQNPQLYPTLTYYINRHTGTPKQRQNTHDRAIYNSVMYVILGFGSSSSIGEPESIAKCTILAA